MKYEQRTCWSNGSVRIDCKEGLSFIPRIYSLFASRCGKLVIIVLTLFFIHILSTNIGAEVTISAIVEDSTIRKLPHTGDVRCIRYADFKQEKIYVDMTLKDYDELVSLSGGITVELRGPHNSRLTFSGQFRVLVMPLDGQDCAINVLSGDADVLTDQRTTISSAGTMLSSERTQYGIQVSRTKEGPTQELFVYDGKVRVQSPTFKRSLVPGQKLIISGAEPSRPVKIESKDIQKTANVYARVDAAKAQIPATAEITPIGLYRELQPLYTNILSDPENANSRLKLATQQLNYGLAMDATYHLTRGESLIEQLQERPPTEEQAEKIAQFEKLLLEAVKKEQAHLFELIERGDYEEAIVGFKRRLEEGRGNSRDYYGLGLCYYRLFRWDSADSFLNTALRLNEEDQQLSQGELDYAERIIADIISQ